MIKNDQRKWCIAHLCICIMLLCVPQVSVAQSNSRTYVTAGKVVDESGNPLPGAIVRIVESKLGSSAKSPDGSFSISGRTSERVQVLATYVGMEPLTINVVGDRSDLRIVLHEATNTLKGIEVRTNINAIDEREKTGVVSNVPMDQLKNKPMANIGLALQGTVPGLVVVNTGELGALPEIRIRGNSSLRKGNVANQPLYVLDGKMISAEMFMLLNPLDIESMRVLKDAVATALYGIKAANGVLEITSKRGFKGKPTLTVSSETGVATRGSHPQKMMDASDKLEYERLLRADGAPGYLLSADFIDRAKLSDVQYLFHTIYGTPMGTDREALKAEGAARLDSLRAVNTDWFDTLMRSTLFTSNYLSLRGGSDDVTYYVSGSFTTQQGQLPGNGMNRASALMSLDWTIGTLGYISLGANASYSKKESPNSSNSSPMELLYNLNAYESPQSHYLYSYNGKKYDDLFNQYHRESDEIGTGASLTFNLDPLRGLNVSGVAGIDMLTYRGKSVTPSTAYSERHEPRESAGFITDDKFIDLAFTGNIRATYMRMFADKHELTLSANYDYYRSLSDRLSATGYGTGKLDFLAGANMSLQGYRKPRFSPSKRQEAQMGAGAAIGYTYDGWADLFATYKADASSLLPKERRLNNAWAVGGGIHWDKFSWAKNDVVTEITTRASFGRTANLAGVQAEETLPVFSYSNNYYNKHRGLEMSVIFNPDLRAEQTSSVDVGLTLGFLKRHSLSLQWYDRVIKDALMVVPIASSNGFRSMHKNIGVLQNTGIEASLTVVPIRNDNVDLTLNFNAAYNDNLVLDLYDASELYTDNTLFIPDYKEGKPYNLLWGWKSLGINPLTGIPTVQGEDGSERPLSGSLSRNDITVLGRGTPPLTGAFGFSLRYKALSCDANFYYTLGGVKPYSFAYVRDPSDAKRNALAGLLDRTWFASGDDDKIYPTPFLDTATRNNFILYPNSEMLASSSFLRLSQVSVQYRVPAEWVQKKSAGTVSYAALSLRGSNLWTLSPYKDGSPEAATTNIPIQPVFTFNITLTL